MAHPANIETLSDRAAANVRNPDHWAPLVKALSNGWSESNSNGTIMLGLAENTLMHDELAKHIKSNFEIDPLSHFTYGRGAQGSPRLRTALAAFINDRFSPRQETQADDFVITAGVTAAIDHATWCICNEGEGILFPAPLYTGFTNDVPTRSRGKLIPVQFRREDGTLDLNDVFDPQANTTCLERALGEAQRDGIRVRAVMITKY
jgi:aspartate/methionine/tyrosine aminotransferase